MTKNDARRVPDGQGDANLLPKVEKLDPARLHEATDRLNAALLEFEAALLGLNLGVSASVSFSSNDDDGQWFTILSFEKVGGTFKLVVESGFEGDENVNQVPICSASREMRLEAVDLLPKLYERLLKAFDTEIVRVEGSVTRVTELARAIRKGAGK